MNKIQVFGNATLSITRSKTQHGPKGWMICLSQIKNDIIAQSKKTIFYRENWTKIISLMKQEVRNILEGN
jgi:hypothetical protein